jgi:hypothetical protein
MNESLIEMYQDGEIENSEILKRICEQANQNVYLALFHKVGANKSNITFDLADYSKILTVAKESEEAMNDYKTPPEDFRSALEIAIMPNTPKSEGEKLGELNEVVEYRQVFRNFLNRIDIMKTAEAQIAEKAFDKMARDTKILVSNGESIGDISKIATRYAKEKLGVDFIKVAKCYDIIHKGLKDNFNIKTGFTKLSSKRINFESEIIKPVHDFTMSIAKIAGLNEMKESVEKVLATFDKTVNTEIKK